MSQANLRLVDRDVMDRNKALEAALGQIERAFGKGSIMRLGAKQSQQGDVEGVSPGSLGLDLARMPPEWISGIGLASGVDVLVHDAQWFESEYPPKVGWGHSCVSDAVTFAHTADAGRLVLWHHDPRHDDEQLEQLGGRASELWRNGGPPPVLAREGEEIDLDS